MFFFFLVFILSTFRGTIDFYIMIIPLVSRFILSQHLHRKRNCLKHWTIYVERLNKNSKFQKGWKNYPEMERKDLLFVFFNSLLFFLPSLEVVTSSPPILKRRGNCFKKLNCFFCCDKDGKRFLFFVRSKNPLTFSKYFSSIFCDVQFSKKKKRKKSHCSFLKFIATP